MPGHISDTKPYIAIVGGKIVKTVPEGTEGSRRREWEAAGRTGVKHEIVYDSWIGKIENIRVIETEFGEMCNVVFEDAILSISTTSRYFTDFAKKACSMDTRKETKIVPFDFEDENGKRKIGVTLYQGDTKLANKFWDEKAKQPTKGFPEPEGDKTKYKSDDWKIYYLRVKKYLVEQIATISFPDDEVTRVSDALGATRVIEDADDDINLASVPF